MHAFAVGYVLLLVITALKKYKRLPAVSDEV